MSAPMVPKHHKRKEICETRAAYREGRQSKAVKVYTINQESRYLLVQGVPAVGGCQELVKLFAVYGAIEEYRVLDDYPAEEFTEVYWFRFKKIQSARFAKRKLDDYSFFGGVLHVCYAPEYESVEETRDKLQDRRKVIAAKLRQHASRTEKAAQQTDTAKNIQYEEKDMEGPGTHTHTDHRQNVPEPSQFPQTQSQNNVSENPEEHIQQSYSQSDLRHGENQGGDNSGLPFINFALPPPPLNMAPPRHTHPHIHPSQYQYAWVPSSHSTLPPNFDGRPESESSRTDSTLTLPKYQNQRHGNELKGSKKNAKSLKPNEKIVNGVIVREYKKPGKALQFIPRQTLKKSNEPEEKESKSKMKTDSVNKELRANAFTLGETQGPTMPGKDDQKLKVHPGAEKSVNQSVKEIRKQISKFISEKVPQQKKSKPS